MPKITKVSNDRFDRMALPFKERKRTPIKKGVQKRLLIVKSHSTKGNESKPVELWNHRDFIKYFYYRYEREFGTPAKVQRQVWGTGSVRISAFRKKLNISNQQYKNFVDHIFDYMLGGDFRLQLKSIFSVKLFRAYQVQVRSIPKREIKRKQADFEKKVPPPTASELEQVRKWINKS